MSAAGCVPHHIPENDHAQRNPKQPRDDVSHRKSSAGEPARSRPYNEGMDTRGRSPSLILTAVLRGLRRRCPHCGLGALFSGFAHHLERCPFCGLVYERNPGDTWAFTIVLDRLPVATGIVLLYFGFGRSHKVLGIATFIVMVALLVLTSPNRWGAGIALHYLSRVYWPDPADPVPSKQSG